MKETHTGWTAQEDAALTFAASEARRQRKPLKTAFDAIAIETISETQATAKPML